MAVSKKSRDGRPAATGLLSCLFFRSIPLGAPFHSSSAKVHCWLVNPWVLFVGTRGHTKERGQPSSHTAAAATAPSRSIDTNHAGRGSTDFMSTR